MVVYEEGNFFGAGSYLPITGMDPVIVVCGSGTTNKLQVGLSDGTDLVLTLGTYATRSWSGKLIKYVKIIEGTARPYYNQTSDAPIFELKGMVFGGTIPNNFAFNPPLLGDCQLRDLESIAPRRVTAGGAALVDEEVASDGSGSGTLVGKQNYPGYIAYISAAISNDALGTSPHDAVITLEDSEDNIIDTIRLGVNTPMKKQIRFSVLGPLTYSYKNGDSVSHWFYLSAYTVVP